MNLELTETQTLIRDTARKFARERVAPQARKFDKEELFPTELFKELASLGLMGVNIPAQYGGAEAGTVSYALAMMEMATACASTSVAMAVTITRDGAIAQLLSNPAATDVVLIEPIWQRQAVESVQRAAALPD